MIRCAAIVVLLLAAGAAHGATARSDNFIITAPNQQLADAVADCAEKWRTYHFVHWFGQEPDQVRDWSKPAEITVELAGPESGGGGATTMVHHPNGAVTDFGGRWLGPYQRLVDAVVPHEVFHTVAHSMHGKPIPRWLDEGWATVTESDTARQMQLQFFREMAQGRRLFRTAELHAMTQYPPDARRMMEMYAQAYVQVEYILATHGRESLPQLLAADGDVRSLGYQSVNQFEQRWLAWVEQGHATPATLRRTEVAYRPRSQQCTGGRCTINPGQWLYRDNQGRWVPFGRLIRGVPPRQQAGPSPQPMTQPHQAGPLSPVPSAPQISTPPATVAPGVSDAIEPQGSPQPSQEAASSDPPAAPEPQPASKSEPTTKSSHDTRPAVAGGAAPAGSSASHWTDRWWFKVLLGVAGLATGGAVALSPQARAVLAVLRIWRRIRKWRRQRVSAPAAPPASTPPESTLRQDTATVIEQMQAQESTAAQPAGTFRLGANRDGTEAHELLELLNLEGENPVLYAYVGLATFEELDRLIDGSNTPEAERAWAKELKRVLQDRINKTIPVTETLPVGV